MAVLKTFKLKRLLIFSISVTLLSVTPVLAANPVCSQLYRSVNSKKAFAELVHLIAELPDHAQIPISVYRKYSTNEIAEAIVLRARAKEKLYHKEVKAIASQSVDLNKLDIILQFPPRFIPSISENGFLNQHQTGASRGAYSPEKRLKIEDANAGLRLGTSPMGLELRPKSALLNVSADINIGKITADSISQFGGIGAVMKSEVKKRALWIAGSSFELGYERARRPRDFSLESLVPYRGTFDRGSLPVREEERYFEVLIYGKLELSDVDHFEVSSPKLAEPLKAFGLPIYVGSWEVLQGHFYNETKHQLIYDPKNPKN